MPRPVAGVAHLHQVVAGETLQIDQVSARVVSKPRGILGEDRREVRASLLEVGPQVVREDGQVRIPAAQLRDPLLVDADLADQDVVVLGGRLPPGGGPRRCCTAPVRSPEPGGTGCGGGWGRRQHRGTRGPKDAGKCHGCGGGEREREWGATHLRPPVVRVALALTLPRTGNIPVVASSRWAYPDGALVTNRSPSPCSTQHLTPASGHEALGIDRPGAPEVAARSVRRAGARRRPSARAQGTDHWLTRSVFSSTTYSLPPGATASPCGVRIFPIVVPAPPKVPMRVPVRVYWATSLTLESAT